jgi:hypothetical protein
LFASHECFSAGSYAAKLLIAVGIGTPGALVAGWRAARYARVDVLTV